MLNFFKLETITVSKDNATKVYCALVSNEDEIGLQFVTDSIEEAHDMLQDETFEVRVAYGGSDYVLKLEYSTLSKNLYVSDESVRAMVVEHFAGDAPCGLFEVVRDECTNNMLAQNDSIYSEYVELCTGFDLFTAYEQIRSKYNLNIASYEEIESDNFDYAIDDIIRNLDCSRTHNVEMDYVVCTTNKHLDEHFNVNTFEIMLDTIE